MGILGDTVASSGRSRPQLRTLCERGGLTFEALAEETGVTISTLRKIEAGRREPLLTTALRLARVLGVEVEELFSS